MPNFPQPGTPLEFSDDSYHRLAAQAHGLNDDERKAVATALGSIEDGTWDHYLWLEDVETPGLVEMFINDSLILVWRLYPGTTDVAQVIYLGMPGLYR